MSATLIQFPEPSKGNGAREAMIDVALTFKNIDEADAAMRSDHMLMALWARGFMLVPVDS